MEHIGRSEQLDKYTKRGIQGRTSERGDLIVWMRDRLNEANRRDGKRDLLAGEVAKRVQGIATKDLGRDLYYLRGQMEEALKTGFPVGACFYTTVKRMREARAKLQAML